MFILRTLEGKNVKGKATGDTKSSFLAFREMHVAVLLSQGPGYQQGSTLVSHLELPGRSFSHFFCYSDKVLDISNFREGDQ